MAYSAKKVSVIINGIYMTDFRDGNIYDYEETQDKFVEYKGVDGKIDYSKNLGTPCQITLGFKHTSPSLKVLNKFYERDIPLDVTIKDSNSEGGKTISGNKGIMMRRPNDSRGKEFSENEVVIMLPNHSVKYD